MDISLVANRRWLALAVRLVVGGTFVYAGAIKISDPLQLADSIAGFQVLPDAMVNPLALGLPPFEIATGMLLILGWMGRAAALGITTVTGVFLVAIVSALARGLTIDCGCFGAEAPSRSRMWLDLGRDLALFAGALLAYRYQGESPRVAPKDN
jgi:uncharacterized membrane protein YphA (DoxX/SURF4 family)